MTAPHAVRVAPPNRGAVPARSYVPRATRRTPTRRRGPRWPLLYALGRGAELALMGFGLVVLVLLWGPR
jgi:hypothetical protein